MLINPFAPGAPDTVNALPPDVYHVQWLLASAPLMQAVVYSVAALGVALVWRSVYK